MNTRNMRLFFILLFLSVSVFILTDCGGSSDVTVPSSVISTATPLPLSTVTPVPVQPSVTPTFGPVMTQTPGPVMTQTSVSVMTPTPVVVPTVIPVPTGPGAVIVITRL